MRIVSLNIRHGGGPRVLALVDYLAEAAADVLIVTEFRLGKTGTTLSEGLRAVGYPHQHWNIAEPRKNAVMLASRLSFEALPFDAPPDDAHRLVGARFRDLDVWGVYMALSREKAAMYEYIHQQRPARTVFIGDFNTGRHRVDETGATFIAAEKFAAMEDIGWIDAWRRQHGTDAREFTWFSRLGNGFRIDHAFVTQDLVSAVADCRYDHWTRLHLTDHSAILLDMKLS